jgi:drug/metabolite transporter (DMT)-like permease
LPAGVVPVSGLISPLLAGELACLGAALLWAVAVVAFREPVRRHGARSINFLKCAIGAGLQGLTLLALGQLDSLVSTSGRALLLIAASAVVGLVLGDTALFAAVGRIGVHLTLLIQTLAPVFAALIAFAWQGERPTAQQSWGAVLILAGVALVVGRRDGSSGPSIAPTRARLLLGTALATIAAFGQGSGVVLAKVGMEELPVMPASFVRLAVAAIGLAAIGGAVTRGGGRTSPFRSPDLLTRIVPASFFGTYVALYLMMAGVAYAPAAVAAVLLATSPVFGLILEAIESRRLPSWSGLLGTLTAIGGVGLLVGD